MSYGTGMNQLQQALHSLAFDISLLEGIDFGFAGISDSNALFQRTMHKTYATETQGSELVDFKTRIPSVTLYYHIEIPLQECSKRNVQLHSRYIDRTL